MAVPNDVAMTRANAVRTASLPSSTPISAQNMKTGAAYRPRNREMDFSSEAINLDGPGNLLVARARSSRFRSTEFLQQRLSFMIVVLKVLLVGMTHRFACLNRHRESFKRLPVSFLIAQNVGHIGRDVFLVLCDR